jgi:Ca2+-transporting ATPase
VKNADIMVGDVIILTTQILYHLTVLYIEGFSLKHDESSLTGEETEAMKVQTRIIHFFWVQKVVNGVSRMLVVATGINSVNGQIIASLEVPSESKHLFKRNYRTADLIAKWCFISLVEW